MAKHPERKIKTRCANCINKIPQNNGTYRCLKSGWEISKKVDAYNNNVQYVAHCGEWE